MATSAAKHEPAKFVKIDSSTQLQEIFQFGHKLGEGAFGSVLLATRLKDKAQFAVKKVAKQKDAKSTYGKSWENEIRVLRRFQHENIVRLDVIFESENNCYLFLEFCDAGTLADELKRRGKFEEKDCCCMLRQLGSALNFLHRHLIVHRDLKLQNCLLRCNPSTNPQHKHQGKGKSPCPFTLKLTDFGLSIELRDVDHPLVDNVGTPAFQAPEIVSGHSYTYKCDIWSFGIVMFWMLHAASPYSCRTEAELTEAVLRYKYSEKCSNCTICAGLSQSCKQALKHLLVPSTVDRWSASEFMASAWVTGTEPGGQQDGNILELMRTLNKAKQADK